MILWDVMDSPLGPLYAAVSPGGVCRISFGIDERRFLEALRPKDAAKKRTEALAPVFAQLEAYFHRKRRRFDMMLDLDGLTPFQVSVLEATRRIPMGSVMTYGEVAAAIGNPRSVRAVGQALGRNPVPIVIPCHRVVAAGGLGGFSGGGGTGSKKRLLLFEGVRGAWSGDQGA